MSKLGGIKFLLKYIKNPTSVGAVLPSSKHLARKMVRPINFESAECIVEYGPGTGVFTEELLLKRKNNTLLILIEKDIAFYNILTEKYSGLRNVRIYNESAENVESILLENGFEKASYIISGLPFASLPKILSKNILEATTKTLSDSGEFITFQYTKIKLDLFRDYFKILPLVREIRNVPPAFVVRCCQKY